MILVYEHETSTQRSFTEEGVLVNGTFNNISAISWQSVLLVEETEVPRENNRPDASQRQTLSHNIALSKPRLSGI
jgi:hypothetical protein